MRRAGCDPSKRWQEQNSAWSSQRVWKAAEGAGAVGEGPMQPPRTPAQPFPMHFQVAFLLPPSPCSILPQPEPALQQREAKQSKPFAPLCPLQRGRAPPAAPAAPSATWGGQGQRVGGTAPRPPHQGAADNALHQPSSSRPFSRRALHLSPDGVFLPLQSNRFRAEQ